ncbi:hypothetical protein H6P81_014747 [Aristolochia fimbriata]|uniref:Uncharacterized protein n=1 Tax=Aristolochia fimbriata TaxID=158543 RepID=A0AAV7E3J8_ARIFI|nr:hypothetical protein H6P81_014747 [Aristolochia fimbriata]
MAATSNATHIDLDLRAVYYPETQVLERLLESPAAEARKWENCSICRVPAELQDHYYDKLYRPKLVSIGPYHHGQPHLTPMEEHKIRALGKSLEKSGKTVDDLKQEFMEADVGALMESYEDLDASEWSDRGKFLELLILDGNFVLELLRPISVMVKVHSISGSLPPDDFYKNYDPVFGIYRPSHLKALYLDILKLENQVPFLVLEKLHLVLAESIKTTTTTTTTVGYLDEHLLVDFPKVREKYKREGRKPMHLLDFFRTKMIGKLSTRTLPTLIALETQSASTYKEAGIAFEPSHDAAISEIKLDTKNVLVLPVRILEFDETLRANLQVYETLYSLGDLEIHSFICFLRSIFQSVADFGLIEDSSAVAEQVLNSFEYIKDGIDFYAHEESNVVTVVEQLNERHRESRKKWRRRFREWGSNFKKTYFSNPWKVLSLFGALLLLGLAFSQTIYSALSYYHPRSS